MNKKSFIHFLKAFGFTRIEKNSYADNYGLNIVFNENLATVADTLGNILCESGSEDAIISEIVNYRAGIRNQGL
jgi:hypothetical protein